MRIIDVEALESISIGCAMLGAGGGGAPRVGKLLAMGAIKKYGTVKVLDEKDEVPDDEWFTSVNVMGTPLVIMEKIVNGSELTKVFKRKEELMEKKFYGVNALEAGGLNSMVPIAVAAELGIPLIDSDGMGRAFPELPMVTYNFCNLDFNPFVLADEKGNEVVVKGINAQWGEKIGRAVCVAMGAQAMISTFTYTGAQMKDCAVWGSLKRAEEIGNIILRKTEQDKDPVDAVLEYTGGCKLFKGKIVDVERAIKGGFNRGSAMIEGIDDCKGSTAVVEFQNENIFATVDGEPVAFTPDLIDFIDVDSAMPIEATDYRYGQRGYLIGIPCHELWRTEGGLSVASPRIFGYDYDYIPVEELAGRRQKNGL